MASPVEMRQIILEKLLGATGEPDEVTKAARSLGERAISEIARRLNEVMASRVEVALTSVGLARIREIRPDAGGFHAMTVGSSDASADTLLMLLDADAIAVLVSAMFGADPDMPVIPIARPLSPLELDVAALAFAASASALEGSGPRALGVRFPLPQPFAGEAIQKHVLRDGPAVKLEFDIALPNGSGRMVVFMPQRVILKYRSVKPSPEEGKTGWAARFGEEVMRSEVRLEATVPLVSMTLGEIAALVPGQILEMPASAQADTRLSARDKVLFVCEFGKIGRNYTVRVSHPFDAGQDLMDGLLPDRAGAER